MNLRAAKVELVGPPRVRLQTLAVEAVTLVAFSYILVSVFS